MLAPNEEPSLKFNNIPEELKLLNQFVVWRYEEIEGKKPTKIPYCADTNHLASTKNHTSWCSFDNAINVINSRLYSGIGFVFTTNDEYCFIDLDYTEDKEIIAKQLQIQKDFDSYSEISPSGKGLHIIIKGSIPKGIKKKGIEIYSSGRYACMTGNIFNDKSIIDYQEKLTKLYNELSEDKSKDRNEGWGKSGNGKYVPTENASTGSGNLNGSKDLNDLRARDLEGSENEKYNDEEIIEQCRNAVNGEKFFKLYSGEWKGDYPSQSEADYAIINIIGFYTKNKSQIKRIFHSSQLGKRDKAKRTDYVNGMITKAFDRDLPSIDFEGYKEVLEKQINNVPVAQLVEPVPHKNLVEGSNPSGHTKKNIEHTKESIKYEHTIIPPPGLMGEIAQFIYEAAPRPVYEIALAGAIGLMAGICGRAYNVSNTGLNQYILLLAKTGMGKEGMASGIDKLMDAIKFDVPNSNHFIGPSHIASGQALIKHLNNKSQCFVSILGEFGLRIQRMSSETAPAHEKMLKQIFLEVYQKSGHNDVFRASIYADSDKDVKSTQSPAFSILGESTPYTFYQSLTEEMIIEGLLPRFMLMEYNGERPNLNEARIEPNNKLVDKFATLCAYCEKLMYNNQVVNIEFTDEAKKTSTEFDKYATSLINKTSNEVVLNLWNRAHLKAIKLAGLIAVGVNIVKPIIVGEYLDYAIQMVCKDIRDLSNKFKKGEVGKTTNEIAQNNELKKLIKEYYTTKLNGYDKYQPYQDYQIIPLSYISIRLRRLSQFYKNPHGVTKGIKQAIEIMINENTLTKITDAQFKKINEKNKLPYLEGYILTDLSLLTDF